MGQLLRHWPIRPAFDTVCADLVRFLVLIVKVPTVAGVEVRVAVVVLTQAKELRDSILSRQGS